MPNNIHAPNDEVIRAIEIADVDDVAALLPINAISDFAGNEIKPLSDTELRATPVPVSGTVELGSSTLTALGSVGVTGPLTDSQLRASPVDVSFSGGIELGAVSLAALESITATGPLTDAQLRTTPVPVSGTVDLGATSLAALESITVGGTVDLGAPSLAALESITATGPLTDTQLRATPVPVSGTVDLGSTSLAALESITVGGTVELGSTSLAALESITASGPLTDAQLRASAVTVTDAGVGATSDVSASTDTGTFSLTALMKRMLTKLPALGAALVAASMPVSLATDHPNVPIFALDSSITGQGSQTAQNQNIVLASAGATAQDTLGYKSIAIQIVPSSGTVTLGQVTFEGSNDNVNFTAVTLYDIGSATANPLSNYAIAANTPRYFAGPLAFRYFRARINVALTGTNTGVQAFTTLRQIQYTPSIQAVTQAVAANLLCTATISGSATVTPVTPTTTFVNAAATTNANFAKASAGTVWSLVLTNQSAATKYVKLYNKASAPTLASDVSVLTIAVPVGIPVTVDGGSNGLRFSTGIAYAMTGAIGDTDTTALAAGDIRMAITFT